MLYYLRDQNGIVGFQYNNDTYYYIKNNQDDIIGILDSNYTIVANYTYDSWGNITSITDGTGFDVSSDFDHIANINPYRYRSYYYDKETNLYYLNSRYYNSVWGRFINADAGFDNSSIFGFNLYSYCDNNPIANTDANGSWKLPKWAKKACAAIVTVAVTAIVTVAVIAAAPVIATAAAVVVAGLGATGATIGTVATAAKVGTVAVGVAVAANGASRTGEIVTGTNVIRDKVMGGNEKAYEAFETTLTVASTGIMAVGSMYSIPEPKNINNQNSVPKIGTPTSQTSKIVKDGYQTRFYDYRGNTSFDIHATEHAPGTHVNPHFHIWDNGNRHTWNP